MEKTQGIIIRLTKLTESSLIVHWCTQDAGVIKTVAKGARRAKSAYAGKLDLFVEAELVWSPARSGGLHKLYEVDIIDYHAGLRGSYGQTVAGTYFCQLIDHVVEPEASVNDYYELLKKGLTYLCQEASWRVVRHFEKRVAELLGIAAVGVDPAYAIRTHCGSLPSAREACRESLKDA